MTTLKDWIGVSQNEQPFIHFESSLDDDQVVTGYVPVKSTLEVLSFLKDATATHTSQGRAVICYGSYGSGKSRLCSVLARLFRDGFDCPALQPVWERLKARGEATRLDELRQTMVPGGEQWRPWLVVTIYAGGPGVTLSTSLIRGLIQAVRRVGLDDGVLGTTIYHAAAVRLSEMIANGASYTPPPESTYATARQLERALEQDNADDALETFREFYRQATFGTEFDEWVRHSGEVSLDAHDVFNTVAERIQRCGYQGIAVIWDEFGFFVEELLRGAEQRERNLGREAMNLQDFIERSCSSDDLGRKVIFLGFTHVSLAEYGSRQALDDTEKDRLGTVSDRFRDPSIPIKLSVTENEGYHLLAGMIHRTDVGRELFSNPLPLLQRISSKMCLHQLWGRFRPHECYEEIVAPCYPLHPSTSAALLLLSDQVSQRARTTFYFLQNKEQHGLAGCLEERAAPEEAEIGRSELVRLHDLFPFFEEAIQESKRDLYIRYQEALGAFPLATDIDVAVLRATLILSVIASRELAPTTEFLSFCFCDSSETERQAHPLHEALRRLSDTASLWKNEATNVWGFAGSQGLTTGLAKDLEEELELVPDNMEPGRLLRRYPEVQSELIDLIGDFDLDPAESGIVRRVGIELLDIGRVEDVQDLGRVNPVKETAAVKWRSALVYLVATDNDAQLAHWRHKAQRMVRPNTYFVLPPRPISLAREELRELVAARSLMDKTDPGTHTYEVLEGKLGRLRSRLIAELQKSFGNDGLRMGTVVIPAGHGDTSLPVSSWNELLPAIAGDLDKDFPAQMHVRCGTFNEWKTAGSVGAIEKIVERIIRFDLNPEWQTQFLGFNDTSQHAAIVDGVLVENGLLKEEPLTEKWILQQVDSQCPIAALQEVVGFFQAGGSRDKEISTLFLKLINPPYGLPNGIVPLMIALVIRTEGSRIAIYSGTQNQRVSDAQLAKAIGDMSIHPVSYRARYNKLVSRQRIVFRAVGEIVGDPIPERALKGEAFYSHCERLRKTLCAWAVDFPEGVVNISDLTDQQRRLTRLLRLQVLPQLPVLADQIVDLFKEDSASAEELAVADSRTNEFPSMLKSWGRYRTTVERYVDGVKASLRDAARAASGRGLDNDEDARRVIEEVFSDASSELPDDSVVSQILKRLADVPEGADPLEDVARAVSGKSTGALAEEDFGHAVGVVRASEEIRRIALDRKERDEFEIVEPNGKRKRIVRFENDAATKWLCDRLRQLREEFGLSDKEIQALLVEAIWSAFHP